MGDKASEQCFALCQAHRSSRRWKLAYRQSSDARAKLRMILRNLGSLTASAASLAESHLILRSRCSGHRLLCRDTLSGYTLTSQTMPPPFLRRLRYANDPRGDLPTTPTTPASSKASRAAERWGALPFCGQPLGMIQR